jgi:hypothetical protein
MRLLKHETPEYLPFFMGMPGQGAVTFGGPLKLINQPCLPTFAPPGPEPEGGWVDWWGVPYTANAEGMFGKMPKPGVIILDDITKWDRVIKAPKLPDVDWEAMAKEDFKDIDRSQVAYLAMSGCSPFLQLVSFMGFTEALCALVEEPETVKEMFNYLADFYVPYITKTLDYYKPDILNIGDDIAAAHAPFFSMETYLDVFKPIYTRLMKPAKDRGVPVDFHCCGKCESYVPHMLDFGVRFWDSAQTMNDLVTVKAKYPDMIICGGYEFPPYIGDQLPDEAYVRKTVRDTIDRLAPGGGLAWGGGFMGTGDMDATMKINGWISDEAWNYGHQFYK